MDYKVNNVQSIPISQKQNKTVPKVPREFEQILEQSIVKEKSIKISSHAKARMQERNIQLDESDMITISQAMDQLKNKGARESLMLYKDVAFIASVNNRTIITALQEKETDIVTNIDSAVIIK